MSLLKKLLGKDKLSKYELEQKKRYKQYVKLGTTSTIVLSKTESEIYQDYFVRKVSTRRSRRKIAAPKKPETQIDIFKEPSTNTLSAAPAVLDAVNKNVSINPIPEEYLADLKQFEAFKVEEDVPSAIVQSQYQMHETDNDCRANTVNTEPLDTKFSYGNQEQFLNKLDEVIRKRSKGESSKVTKNENLQNNIEENRQSFEEENDSDVPIVRPRKKGTKKKQENQRGETMDETDGTTIQVNWQHVTDSYQADDTGKEENPEKTNTFYEKAEVVTQNWQHVTDYYQADGTRIQENPEKVDTFPEKAEIVTLNWQQVTDYYQADGTRIQENPEKVDTFSEEAEIPTQNWQHGTDNYQSESEELIWGTPPINIDGANVTRSDSCITTQSDDSFFDCHSEDDDIYGDGEKNIMKQISPHFKDHDDKLDSKGFDSEDLYEEEFLDPPKYNTISDEVPIQQMKADNQEIQHDSLNDQQSSFTNDKVDNTDALLEDSIEPDSLEITLNPTLINHTHAEPFKNNINNWPRPIHIKESDFVFKGDSREEPYEFAEVQRQNEALFLDENYKPPQTINTFVSDPEFLKIFEKPRSRKNHLIKLENNNDYSDIEMENGKAEGKKVTFDFGKSYCQRYEADNDPEENELIDPYLLSTLTREEGQVFMPIDNEVYFEIYHNRHNRNKKPKIYPKTEEIPNDDRSQIFLSYGVQLSPTESTKTSKSLGNMDVAFLNCRDGFDIHIPKPTTSIKIAELVDEDDNNNHDVQNVNKSSQETNESSANNETNADPVHPKIPLKRPATWGEISNKNGFNNEMQDQNSIFREEQFDNNDNYNAQNVNESSPKVNESFTNNKEGADTTHTKAKHSTTWKNYALLGQNRFNSEQQNISFNKQNSEKSNTFKENNNSTNNTKSSKDLSLPLVEDKAFKEEHREDFEVTTINDISQEILQENKSNEFTKPETLIEHNTINTNENNYKEKEHPVSNADDLQPEMEEPVIIEKDNVNYPQEPSYVQGENQVNKINFVMQTVRLIESGPTRKGNFNIEKNKSATPHKQDYHQQNENSRPEGLSYISNTNRKHIEKIDSSIPDQTFHINHPHKLNETPTSENAVTSENRLNNRKFDAGSLKRDLQSPLPKEDEIESESVHSPNHFNKHTSFEGYHNNSSYESSKDSQFPKENGIKPESTKYSIETISPNFPNQTSRNCRQSPTPIKTENFFEDHYEISNSKSPETVQLLEEDEVVKQNIEYSRKPTSPRSPKQDLALSYSFDLTQNSSSRNKDSTPKIHNVAQNSNSTKTDSITEDDTKYSQNFNDFKQTPTSTERNFFIDDNNRVPNVLEFTIPNEESLNENQRETNSPNYSRDFIQSSVTAIEDPPSEEHKNKHLESFKKDWQIPSPRENKALDEGNEHSMESLSPNQIFTSKYSRKFFEPSISTEFTTISETKPTLEEHHTPSSRHEEKISLENRDEPKNTIKFAVEDRTSRYFENQGINKSTSPPSEKINLRNKNLRYEKPTPRNPLSKIFGRSLSHGHISPPHTYQKPHGNIRSSLDRNLLQQYDEHDMSAVKNCEKDEKEEQTSNEPIENKQHTLQSVKEVQRRLSEVRNIKNVAEQLVVMQDILLNLQRRADVLESKTDDEYILLLQSLFKSVRIVSGLQCNFDETLLHSQRNTLRDIKACINELNIK